MSFDDWLTKVKESIADVEMLVREFEAELTAAAKRLGPYKQEASSLGIEARETEGRGSAASRNSDASSRIRRSIALLQHDVEVIITTDALIKAAKIDLDRVFDPFVGEYGARIEQSSRAAFSHVSTDPCDVAVYGQGSLRVPLRLDLLGSATTGSLHVNISPKLPASGTQSLGVAISRLPSSCGDFGSSIALQVEDRATTSLLPLLGQVLIELPQLDFLPMAATFNAAWIDDALRIVGSHGGRRTRRPLLPSVQNGFELALKIDQEFIWRFIRSAVNDIGAKIFGSPSVTGPKSFSLIVGMQESGALRIGCDVISWTVTVKISLVFDLLIQGQRVLVISGRPIGGPSVDIDIRPSVIGWLLGDLRRLAETFIANKVPPLGNIRRDFMVGSVRQLEAEFWNEFIVLSINV